MKPASTKVAVPYSLVFIRDPEIRDELEIDGVGALWASDKSIAVGCLPDSDGDTFVSIGPDQGAEEGLKLAYEGHLQTPSRTVVAELVPETEILRVEVTNSVTRLRVWTDGHRDSAIVVVGLS